MMAPKRRQVGSAFDQASVRHPDLEMTQNVQGQRNPGSQMDPKWAEPDVLDSAAQHLSAMAKSLSQSKY